MSGLMSTPSPALVLAATLAAAAVALLVPGGPRRWTPTARDAARAVPAVVAAAVVMVGLLVPHAVVPAVIAGGATVGGWALWRRRAERLAVGRVAARVVESCEQLAAELASGQPPGHALERAAGDWPVLAPAAEAWRVGADVPTALRDLARLPGAAELRWVAAAWQLAARTGQGLAEAVDRVAEELRARQVTQRVVDGELASARATARLVAALPVAALLLGSGMGGDPWAFLLHTPVGLGSLAAGLALGWLGLWWIEAVARGVER